MAFRSREDGFCAFCGDWIFEGDVITLASGTTFEGIEVARAPCCCDCRDEGLFYDELDDDDG
jgi:hypothetical protein